MRSAAVFMFAIPIRLRRSGTSATEKDYCLYMVFNFLLEYKLKHELKEFCVRCGTEAFSDRCNFQRFASDVE